MKLHLSEDLALPADAITQKAHGMAMDLLRNGFGEEGARLVITTQDGRDLGGWGLPALVEKFAAALAVARDAALEEAAGAVEIPPPPDPVAVQLLAPYMWAVTCWAAKEAAAIRSMKNVERKSAPAK